MARKKKVIHWSKLPRAKLVSMVKRLQADKTKLQLQLAQARETKLLNERVDVSFTLTDLDRQSPAMREAAQLRVRDTEAAWQNANRDQAGVVTGRASYVVEDNSALDEMLEHGVVHITQRDQAYLGPELGVVNVAPGPFPWEKE